MKNMHIHIYIYTYTHGSLYIYIYTLEVNHNLRNSGPCWAIYLMLLAGAWAEGSDVDGARSI